MTIQDLRPNSQDTSAFYLGNIYGVLADPNATRTSIPSPVAKPPLFSPPRSAVLVNLLWFLSLVISLSCALLATSLHQWARRYIRLTQPARCSPEKRARLRAFFADGVDNLQIPWAVEGLPTLLHLSLFLFFGGLVVFLFNVDQEVFIGVVTWIGIFSTMYGSITPSVTNSRSTAAGVGRTTAAATCALIVSMIASSFVIGVAALAGYPAPLFGIGCVRMPLTGLAPPR